MFFDNRMNSLEYYTNRVRVPYTEEDINNIKNDYTIKNMNIIEIGNKYKRTPGQIAYQLGKYNIIKYYEEARGYDEYKVSSLYKEIKDIESVKKKERNDNKLEKQEKKVIKAKTKDDKLVKYCDDINLINNKIDKLSSEINEMKVGINKILELINLMYDFEQQ